MENNDCGKCKKADVCKYKEELDRLYKESSEIIKDYPKIFRILISCSSKWADNHMGLK